MPDPGTTCEDSELCDVSGCPRISLRPCETVDGCEYAAYCMGGSLCAMILAPTVDTSAEGRELKELMAELRAI